jgi:hypothetical protein
MNHAIEAMAHEGKGPTVANFYSAQSPFTMRFVA